MLPPPLVPLFPSLVRLGRQRCVCLFLFLASIIGVKGAAGDGGQRHPDLSLTVAQREPIVVGATSDSFPYGYIDSDGAWTGFAVDLFDAVARVMNIRIRREVDTGMGLHARFRAGEFDVLQAYSQTPEREVYTDFSVPFLTLQGCVFVRKHDSPIRTWEDFNNREFAIIGERSIGEKFLRDRKLVVRPVYVSSSEEGLRLVNNGRCAGVFVSYLTAVSVIESVGLKDVTRFRDPIPEYDIRHSFAVHKGDAQLLARINEGLAILHRNGEYQRIYRKWFGRFESPVFTREQVVGYVALALGLALAATTWGLLRQRALSRRIRRQTAELLEQETLLQALYDNIPVAITVIEAAPEGFRVLTLNRQAEAYFGVAARSAAGRMLNDVALEPEWKDHLDDLLRRWPAGTALVREEHKLAAKHKHLVITLLPLSPSSSGSRRLCVLAEDVTQRRELDEEISQSRKLRAVGELVGGIAHEFNNLLTPVMLQVGEIQADWAGDPKLQQALDVISRAMTRAAELTRRLLTFGRRAERRSEPVQIASLVASCFELLRQTVDRRIVLEAELQKDLPPLVLNSTDVHQVLLNLLLNARDTLLDKLSQTHGDWRATIHVEAVQLPPDTVSLPGSRGEGALVGWQRLTVRDNGMGISADVRERIFEPFYTTKEVGRGSGLGLATVWHVVTDAGGRVEVESKPGEGSAFHVYLPVWSSVSRPPVAAVAHTLPTGKLASILLAEDEDLVARTIVSSLRRFGHQVIHFPDGSSAWKHLETNCAYDLMIFDVNMPGIDGIDLTRRVRTGLRYPGKIMIISGRLTSTDLDALTDIKVDLVLPKPFTPDQLIEAVRRVTNGEPPPSSSSTPPIRNTHPVV